MDNYKFVENIKYYIKKKDFTIAQVEKQLGWSTGLISRWKTMSPALDKIVALSELIEVSVDTLLGQETEPGHKNHSQNSMQLIQDWSVELNVDWHELTVDSNFGQGIREFIEEQAVEEQICLYCMHGDGYILLLVQFGSPDKPMGLKLLTMAGKNDAPYAVPVDLDQLVDLLRIANHELYKRWSERRGELYWSGLSEDT